MEVLCVRVGPLRPTPLLEPASGQLKAQPARQATHSFSREVSVSSLGSWQSLLAPLFHFAL